MASWQRRRGKCVTVTYYDTKAGKLVAIPRTLTRHLDDKSDDEINQWVRQWESEHGKEKDRIGRTIIWKDSRLQKHWEAYQINQARISKRRPTTIESENREFERYIIGFFVREHRKKDPTQWHSLVPAFHNWLYEQPIIDATRRSILWTLERFGKFLVYSQHMVWPFTIQPPNAQNLKTTPLKVRLRPEDIFKILKTHNFSRPHKKHASTKRICQINFQLAILLGYFASLGPEELWALEKRDIQGGELGMDRSKTYLGFKDAGLGSKLSVTINKTITGGKVTPEVKNDYRFGYVTIWHPEAAKMIANILKDLPEGRLFPYSRGYADRAWRELVYPILGATVHDLRRASSLYLGRTVRIPPTLLQEHMRHAELDTTMLYCREPKVESIGEKSLVVQDLDDIV